MAPACSKAYQHVLAQLAQLVAQAVRGQNSSLRLLPGYKPAALLIAQNVHAFAAVTAVSQRWPPPSVSVLRMAILYTSLLHEKGRDIFSVCTFSKLAHVFTSIWPVCIGICHFHIEFYFIYTLEAECMCAVCRVQGVSRVTCYDSKKQPIMCRLCYMSISPPLNPLQFLEDIQVECITSMKNIFKKCIGM